MTPDEASQIRTEHDAYVRYLTRQTKTALAGLHRTELLHRGVILVTGGPQSKDELVAALIDARYPRNITDEMTHVLYHKAGENWSACTHCTADVQPVCGRCGRPAHKVEDATEFGQPVEIWHHDSVADDVFCVLVMHAADRHATRAAQ